MKTPLLMLISACCAAAAFCTSTPVAAQQKDNVNCKDHPLFTRMPDSWIHDCDTKEFNGFAFPVAEKKTTMVEGKYWRITYYPQATAATKPSELQILRNFETAVRKAGGTSVYLERSRETFKIVRGGKEYWIALWAEFTGKYGFTIVEKGGMDQDIIANADALAGDIRSNGHAAVYGIHFDTGKSTILPESAASIAEIANMLNADPALAVYVVGHTDNTGSFDANITLSQDRARAVVAALTGTHGIDAARLKAHGAGPCAPVATNETEEGRAANRRVELVRQ